MNQLKVLLALAGTWLLLFQAFAQPVRTLILRPAGQETSRAWYFAAPGRPEKRA
jgi:hypothetical protein